MSKIRVSIVECAGYDIRLVKDAVRESVSLIGGWDGIVKRGKRVLVKPNMLSARPPEDGVTTHPAIVWGERTGGTWGISGRFAAIGKSPGSRGHLW